MLGYVGVIIVCILGYRYFDIEEDGEKIEKGRRFLPKPSKSS